MAGLIKHVGKHDNKRVVLVRRKVPNEDTNALVVYTEYLPQLFHDDLMKAVESEPGQAALSLDDVLFRSTMQDGRNLLQALHTEGFIKKVPTMQIIITPTNKDSVRLDELNKLLDEMEAGDPNAVRIKAEQQGLADPSKRTKANVPLIDQVPGSRAGQTKGESVDVSSQIAALTEQVAQLSKTISEMQKQDNNNATQEDPKV